MKNDQLIEENKQKNCLDVNHRKLGSVVRDFRLEKALKLSQPLTPWLWGIVLCNERK